MLISFSALRFIQVTVCSLLFIAVAQSCAVATANPDPQPASVREALDIMIADATDATVGEFTFVQTTIRYGIDGNPRDTGTWYEAMQFPSSFRIDFGEPNSGNAVIYHRDSVYQIRGGELMISGPEIQEFLVVEGGIHSYPADDILKRLSELNLDTSVFELDTLDDRVYWAFGGDTGMKCWFDREHHSLVRHRSTLPDGRALESVFSDFQQFGDFWCESRVRIYLDGKLFQDEFYHDIDVDPQIPESLFDAERYGEAHWVKTPKE